MVLHANGSQSKTTVIIFIWENIQLYKKYYKRQWRTLHKEQGINTRGNIKIVNIYAPYMGALQYIRQGGTVVKNPPANASHTKYTALIPGLGRSPEVGNGNPLQYSCLKNSMDRGACWATVHKGQNSWIRLNTYTNKHSNHKGRNQM